MPTTTTYLFLIAAIVAEVIGMTNLAKAGQWDLYIIATKADGVGPAAQAIKPLAGPQSVVLTIQNGLGAAERIQQFRPPGISR